MAKRKLLGMEQHGVHLEMLFEELVLFVTTVRSVTDDGVQDVGHVLAQLMHSAGCGREFNKGVTGGGVFTEG